MSTAEELSDEIRQHIEARQYRAAAKSCSRLNSEFPDYAEGWFIASRLAIVNQQPEAGLRAIDRALDLAPENMELLIQRLRCLRLTGHAAEARVVASQLASMDFNSPEISFELASILTRLGMHEGAAHHYRRAAAQESDNPDYLFKLATCEFTLGNIDAALDALDQCLTIRPNDAGALFFRSTIYKQTPVNNHVDELESAIQSGAGSQDDVIRLRFTLAKELDDLEQYERSFEQLNLGASLLRGQLNYSLPNELETMRVARNAFGSEKFDGSVTGYVSADPIFIVGMPRTGTALVDEILRSHPVVQSVGSSHAFNNALTKECMQGRSRPAASLEEFMARALDADFERMGEDYVNSARPIVGDIAHFVDNLPMNFVYAGMIHLALPKARIVVLERDPMDTCFFAYRSLFEGAFPFSYDLDEIAGFYNGYREQVAHWQSVMPGIMHTVRYEELVTNPKPVIEDLLEYCSLSFDEACLTFWEGGGVVVRGELQPSRQDVFRESIGKWKHYATQLAPLREKIGA